MEPAQRRLLIVAASVMVSFSAVFVRWSDAPSSVLAFYRMLFSSLFIVPVAVFRCGKELRSISKDDLLLAIVSGALFAFHFLCYFESLDMVSIASATVLADTAVFFVAAIMTVFFRESISRRNWIVMTVTFGGCALIACGDSVLELGVAGDLVALISSALFAVYAVIGRRVRSRVSTLAYTSVVYSAATVTMLLLVCCGDASSLDCGYGNLLCALGLAVFCTLLGHTVYNWGLKYEKAAFVAITTLLEPVFGTVLGLLVFGEVPGMLVAIGAIIVLAGIYLFSTSAEPRTADRV